MTLSITLPDNVDMKPKITVIGVGGAGGNAINNMINSELHGVEFWVANTDAQALQMSLTENRIQLGATSTKGLGAGSHPEIGKIAAEESMSEICSAIESTNMLFIAAGLGGGTGTGAAPVIAKIAKEKGILVVGIVTKPFHFEGIRRMKTAELGLEEFQKYCGTVIVIPNQNLFRSANEKTTFKQAFEMADAVLHLGIRSITDLMVLPGLINLDFADVRAIMEEMGKAMMGTGEAEGENRALRAAEYAISNPLLDNSSMKGAKGVLINITGGEDMTLFDVDEAANRIREEVDPEANIIFGSAFNNDLNGKLRVSVVATGIDADQFRKKSDNYSVKTENIIKTASVEVREYANDVRVEKDEPKQSFITPQAYEPEEFKFSLSKDFTENNQANDEKHDKPSKQVDNKDDYLKSSANTDSIDSFANNPKPFSIFKMGFSNKSNLNEDSKLEVPAFLRRQK